MVRPSLLLPPLLVVAACQQKVPEPTPAPAASHVDLQRTKVDPPAPVVTALEKEDLVVGKGAAAKAGDRVKVHYTGWLLDGTKFDSSHDRPDPFTFTLGQGQVIKGWDEGVVGMKPGGKRKLTIPSELGYGKQGSPPTIPPNAPLRFEVELLSIGE